VIFFFATGSRFFFSNRIAILVRKSISDFDLRIDQRFSLQKRSAISGSKSISDFHLQNAIRF